MHFLFCTAPWSLSPRWRTTKSAWLLKQKKPVEKEETEEERSARLEALAVVAKEAAIRREEAARQRFQERLEHEQVWCRIRLQPFFHDMRLYTKHARSSL